MPYTEAQKKKAVELYVEHGADTAASETGCSRQTIYNWLGLDSVKPEKREQIVQRHQEKREALREALLDKALQGIIAADPSDPRGFQSLSIGAATFLDKYRLEMGEHTARTVQEGSEDIDRSVAQLVAELNRRAKAEAEGSTLG